MAKQTREYALYKGDKFLSIGTLKELAEFLKIKYASIRFLNSKAYKKRCKGKNHLELVEMYDVTDQYDDIIGRN